MKKEVNIALVAIVGLVVLFFGMSFLKGLQLFSNDVSYFIKFNDISGLSTSSPIYANGYPVGSVKNINYDYSKPHEIMVEISVNKEMTIPEGSKAQISSDMLGNVRVNLNLGQIPGPKIKPGGVIDGFVASGALADVQQMLPEVQKLLPKLDSILGNLNTLSRDPAIAQSLHNVRNITNDLTYTTKELNTLMATLNHQVPGMLTKANGVLDNTQTLTATLNSKVEGLDIEKTMSSVNTALANVQKFTDELNNNQGSLGLLMRDPSLYNNLTTTVSSADSLLIDLKAHPKRYVHFSIFGKKDK